MGSNRLAGAWLLELHRQSWAAQSQMFQEREINCSLIDATAILGLLQQPNPHSTNTQHLFFSLLLIFKLQKYDNTFTGDLENTERSYIQFHYIF